MVQYHVPVLLQECIEGLHINPSGIYVDLTFGGGGYSNAILQQLDRGKLVAFDVDEDVEGHIPQDERFKFIRSNFRFFANFVQHLEIDRVDGIVADLGVSLHQLEARERGFSFMGNDALDMRMNMGIKQSAADILNTYNQQHLETLFREYGELENAKRLSYRIVEFRAEKKLKTAEELKQLAHGLYPKHKEFKYMARLFQSLRIEVNQEMDVLKEMLLSTIQVLKPGGRLVVVTYHSLEDRIVKTFMANGGFDLVTESDVYGNYNKVFQLVNKKVIVPSEKELSENSRSRSAKLRIAERTTYNV